MNPEYSLEELLLKLKLYSFGQLMRRTDSLEKTSMLGKVERIRRRAQRMRWIDSPTPWIWIWSKLWKIVEDRGVWCVAVHQVAKSWTRLSDWTELTYCSMPGFPAHHQLPEPTQTSQCPSSQWCHPTSSSSIIPFSSHLQTFPASGSFQMSQLFASGGRSIGVSVSASVLPMNTQNWYALGWTGWISLQSKGLSRVFSNTTVQKHQFFSAQLSL